MDFYESLARYEDPSIAEGLLKTASTEPYHGLYLNSLRLKDEELLSLYPKLNPHPIVPHAYIYKEDDYLMGREMLFDIGGYYVIDPSSCLPPFFLDPKPGERILDLCAAPGGKSCLMSLMMKGEGIILSHDIDYPRSKENSRNIERMGLGNVAVVSSKDGFPFARYQGYFSAILLDAPCSSSALFRKSKEARDGWSYKKVASCAATQKDLLAKAATCLASGGRILYSTCSFSYEEDEEVILDFLASHTDFEAVALPDSPLYYRHRSLPQAIHLFPHLFPGEGQFLCLLRHKGEKAVLSKETPSRIKGDIPYQEELNGMSFIKTQDSVYALKENVRLDGLALLRPGVRLFDDKGNPDFALARYLPGRLGIQLSNEEAKAYLHGDGFKVNEKDGFIPVSYRNINLGFGKVVSGYLKNHYPKGLRRNY